MENKKDLLVWAILIVGALILLKITFMIASFILANPLQTILLAAIIWFGYKFYKKNLH